MTKVSKKGISLSQMVAAEIAATGTYELKDAVIKVTLSQTEKDAVVQAAAERGVTISELVRRFIRKGLEES